MRGEFPLADLRMFFQVAEELQVNFLVDFAHEIRRWQRPDRRVQLLKVSGFAALLWIPDQIRVDNLRHATALQRF